MDYGQINQGWIITEKKLYFACTSLEYSQIYTLIFKKLQIENIRIPGSKFALAQRTLISERKEVTKHYQNSLEFSI